LLTFRWVRQEVPMLLMATTTIRMMVTEGTREVTGGGGGMNGSLIKFFCKNQPMS
jgi:hypothetical protein